MKHILLVLILSAASVMPASAQVPHNALAICIAQQTTGADREHFALWFFAIVSKHPVAAPLANVRQTDHERIDMQTADLIERLLTEDCLEAARITLRRSGEEGLGNAFRELGEIAVKELFRNEEVVKSSMNYMKYLDEDLFSKLFN